MGDAGVHLNGNQHQQQHHHHLVEGLKTSLNGHVNHIGDDGGADHNAHVNFSHAGGDDDDNNNNNNDGQYAVAVGTGTAEDIASMYKKKRLCRFPGCSKVIKSQGHCQRHGAKAKRCKITGCEKQAQGTHDGMCKRHWKAIHFPEPASPKEEQPPPPQGESVYDTILPQSIAFRPTNMPASAAAAAAALMKPKPQPSSASSTGAEEEPPEPPEGVILMPLLVFLRQGINKPAGWHRNAERRARGLYPVQSISSQLEPWERQLALVEILLLSGGTPYANFRHLSHAWGREKGFHNVLANSVCERRGEVERKRRSDAGKQLSEEQKSEFRKKLKKARGSGKKGKGGDAAGGGSSVGGSSVGANENNDQDTPSAEQRTQQQQQQQQQHQKSQNANDIADMAENRAMV